MSGRTILSRPRTRIYDANYNIGQNYYRPALDRLDQKYSPRQLSPGHTSTIAKEILARHEQAFADEDLATSRRRAEKHIGESNLFDLRGGRIAQRALDLVENDFDEETASALKRIRANKKVSVIDDADFESTVNNISSHRLLDRSEKALRSVGLDESSRRALDDDITIKRRSLKVSYQGDSDDLVKWSPYKSQEEIKETAAAIRARKSRERINDIEDEMAALSEKQAARERRAARLKALVAESAEETEAAQSAIKAVSFRSRMEQRTLEE